MLNSTYKSPISPSVSWYEDSLSERPVYSALEDDVQCDVVVIGGGFCGLSAAYHLAKGGSSVVLIEAYRFGDGASGRNGGQIGTGQRYGVVELEEQFGFERAKALFQIAENAKQNLHDIAGENNFEYDYLPGQISCLYKARDVEEEKQFIAVMNEKYDYDKISFIDKAKTSELLGTDLYHGGALDQGTGHIHPMKYVVGLAKSASNAGAKMCENTKATGIESTKSASGETVIKVKTAKGTITAQNCIMATNAYGDDLEPVTARHVLPIQSFIGATEPLGDELNVLPEKHSVDDSRFMLRYYRKTKDNRLLFGGREAYTSAWPTDVGKHIRKQMVELYPHLQDVPFTHAWGGSVGITPSRLPFVREVKPGVISAAGFSGHGVMMANYTGRMMAESLMGKTSELDVIKDLDISAFPGGRTFSKPLLFLALTWFAFLDKF
jgi:gamma-glutamylputrescine oxidase